MSEFELSGRRMDSRERECRSHRVGARAFEVGQKDCRGAEYDDEPSAVIWTSKPDGDAPKGEAAWEYRGMSGTFPFVGMS